MSRATSCEFLRATKLLNERIFFDEISRKCDFSIEQHLKKKFFFSFQKFFLNLHFLNSLRLQSSVFRQIRELENEILSKLIDEILEILFLFDDVLFSRNVIVRLEVVRHANIIEFNFLILSFVRRENFDF